MSLECVLARADLVDLGETEDVAELDVAEAGYGEEVAWRKEVLAAGYGGDNIARRLATDGREGRRQRASGCSGSSRGLGMKRSRGDLAQCYSENAGSMYAVNVSNNEHVRLKKADIALDAEHDEHGGHRGT